MKRTYLMPAFRLVLGGLALAGLAVADPGDPPGRVARLNYLTGNVSYRPGSVEEWAGATPNYPLTTGYHLWADEGAGVELHIGSTAIRLAGQTALEFLNLDDQAVQLSVPQGALNIRLRRLDDDQVFEVDTPYGAISLMRTGDYRIDVVPGENAAYVTVRAGEAEITGAGNPFVVHPREMARIGGDPVSADVNAVRAPDAWDDWCLDRDRREDQAAAVSARYVPREMVGYEDLAANGDWRPMPGYGDVWVPRVQAGWAPYHYGHWAWVDPWGWTWVDDAPWGFAPFHYGRWAFAGGVWVWAPGAVVARPVYAPALVAFVGGGGIGVGVAAWFPLGPHEAYVPAYHVSAVYVRQVNITHVTNITTVTTVTNVRYVNQTVPGAVMAVPHAAFVGAQPVARVAVNVNVNVVAHAQVMTAAPVAPTRVSVMGRASAGVVARPPAAIGARVVVAKATPPPAPVPFATRQQALAANPGHPVEPAALNQMRTAEPMRPTVRTAAQTNNAAAPAVPNPRPQRIANQPPAPVPAEHTAPPRPNVERPAAQATPAAAAPAHPELRPAARDERNVERPNAQRPSTPAPTAAAAPARPEPRSAARDERKEENKEKKGTKKEERKRPEQ